MGRPPQPAEDDVVRAVAPAGKVRGGPPQEDFPEPRLSRPCGRRYGSTPWGDPVLSSTKWETSTLPALTPRHARATAISGPPEQERSTGPGEVMEAPMSWGSGIRGLGRGLVEWLFPRVCSLCADPDAPEDPCGDCERSLELVPPDTVCARCAALLPAGAAPVSAPPSGAYAVTRTAAPSGARTTKGTPRLCPACLVRPPPYDRVIAPWSFVPPLSGLIHRMKYHRDLAAAGALGRLLASKLGAGPGFPAPDAVIGLPQSRRRLLQRGFNHAEELAAIVRKSLDVARPHGILIARRHSPPQARTRSAAERHANVANAFTVRRWPPGLRRVAVVDDVLTTGATVSALARALKASGAERVDVWCCARTPLA